jgi:DNA repair photolyase
VRQIAQAGAASVTPIVLHLRTGAREWFFRWLGQAHPDLMHRYRALYGRGAYAPAAYQKQVTEQVRELARRYGVGRGAPSVARRGSPGRFTPPAERRAGFQAVAPQQLTLL